jgi:hypothetical protein
MKTCTRCKENKPITLFSLQKAGKDGICSICKSCIKLSDHDRRLRNRESLLIKERERYLADPKKYSEAVMKSARKHRVKTRERGRRYAQANRAKINEQNRERHKVKPHLKRSTRRKRDATKLSATPSWLTKDHNNQINSLHEIAINLQKEDGILRHIDHIIPLVNKDVCGLHVPWNLQILTINENCCKKNRFDGTYSNESWRE